MPRHRKAGNDLHARSRKSRGGGRGRGFSFETYLAAIVLLFLGIGLGWFLWPGLTGDNDTASDAKVKKLTEKNPTAEVFELGTAEKKSP